MFNHTTSVGIPKSIKIFTWILIFAGFFFFYVYTFNPSICFQNANLDSYSAKIGFSSTGVRILGSILALLISVISNNNRWLIITLISRIFVELGDALLGIIIDGVTINTYALVVLANIEFVALLKTWRADKLNYYLK